MLTAIIIIVVLSVIAIIAEMVLPAGILGVAGAIGLVAAVVMVYGEYGATAGLLTFLGASMFGAISFWYWMKNFHRLPFTRNMVHRTEVGDDAARSDMRSMIGKTGVALTEMMPSGRALIEGEKISVIAESGVIDKDAELRVVGTSGASLVVRTISAD